MDRELTEACARVGWEELYGPYFPNGFRQQSSRGEVYERSPFPFSNDGRASFQLNLVNGMWRDWHAEHIIGVPGGNFVQFLGYMNPRYDRDGTTPIADFGQAERWLKGRLGIGEPIDAQWVAASQRALADPDCYGHQTWMGRKPWHRETLTRLGIGWDHNRGRLVIPCHETTGLVVNARLYRPGATPKMLWMQTGMGGNFLFPHSGWQEPWVVLCEGEGDAISLRTFGYNGVSGTMGAGNPVPEGNWWFGKQIFVLMDNDAAGREAQATAIRILREGAREVRVVQLPSWEGMSAKPDVSEWIMHLLDIGFQPDQVQREITRLLTESTSAPTENAVLDSEPEETPFAEALTARNSGSRISFGAHVISKSDITYSTPTNVDITCPGTGFAMCRTCVMHTQYHGNAQITLDPRAPLALKTIMVEESKRDSAILRHLHIPSRCPLPRVNVTRSADLGVLVLTNTVEESRKSRASYHQHKRHEALVYLTEGNPDIDQATDYAMTGHVRTMPSSQKSVLFIDTFERTKSALTEFRRTPEAIQMLESFRPTHDVVSALVAVGDDLAKSTTMIRGRLDLHLMIRSVYHSVLSFPFGGAIHHRGWLEAFIVGDTRCGKSATFSALSEMFGTGVLVDCKMQTAVGLLGAVETSTMTGERYVVAGLFPQQDGTGPICLDEFASGKWEKSPLMDHLSQTRASGITTITKAASATFTSRVRLVTMANPGQGRLMRELGGFGCETLLRLIPQPEDIARFDMAMAVSQEDVPMDQINTLARPSTPQWSKEAHRMLLAWTWSRRPDQVVWGDGAEAAVIELATKMVERYDSAIPLVEPSDQRMRVAKLAVSIAAQCYSTDNTGELIVVKTEHVLATASMFATWYDKPSFGYDRFSHKARSERYITDPRKVMEMLDRVLGEDALVLAERLMRTWRFNERTFSTLIPMKFTDVHPTLQTLSINRCIRVAGDRGDMYETTPAFTELLKQYIQIKTGS